MGGGEPAAGAMPNDVSAMPSGPVTRSAIRSESEVPVARASSTPRRFAPLSYNQPSPGWHASGSAASRAANSSSVPIGFVSDAMRKSVSSRTGAASGSNATRPPQRTSVRPRMRTAAA